jgi:hypothetical protein
LHFLRWWESVHHTDEVTKEPLSESTLLDYVRFQSSQERELTRATINQRVAIVDRALRIAFPGSSGQIAPALQSTYWQREPMGIGKPRPALSRLRVKTAKRTIEPLSVDEVARFWNRLAIPIGRFGVTIDQRRYVSTSKHGACDILVGLCG